MAMANKTKSVQIALLLAGPLTAACLLSAPARAQSWLGILSPNEKPVSATIDYNERPKLKVPPQKVLPPPAPVPERRVDNAADPAETLTKPQAEYLEKVKGADGKVSGLQDGDEGKSKFLGFF